MLLWVTAGLIAPGVQCGSGSVFGAEPRAWQEPAGSWGWTTALLTPLTGSRPTAAGVLLESPAGELLLDELPQPASTTRQIKLTRPQITVQLCHGQPQGG